MTAESRVREWLVHRHLAVHDSWRLPELSTYQFSEIISVGSDDYDSCISRMAASAAAISFAHHPYAPLCYSTRLVGHRRPPRGQDPMWSYECDTA